MSVINPLTGKKLSLTSKIYKLLTNDTVFKNKDGILVPLNKKLYFFDENRNIWLHKKFMKSKKESKPKKQKPESKPEKQKPESKKIFLLKDSEKIDEEVIYDKGGVKASKVNARFTDEELKAMKERDKKNEIRRQEELKKAKAEYEKAKEEHDKNKSEDEPEMNLFKYFLQKHKDLYKKFLLFLKNRKRLKDDFNKFIDKYENSEYNDKEYIREHNNLFERIRKKIKQQNEDYIRNDNYLLHDDLLYKMLLNMVNLSKSKRNQKLLTSINEFIHPQTLDLRKETKYNIKKPTTESNKYNILPEDYENLKQYLK